MGDEEDVFEYLPVRTTACRQDLYVARTRIRDAGSNELYDFWGLFCHNDIASGEFIGMYNGIWMHAAEGTFAFGNRYAIEVASSLLVAPPGQRPDPQLYPIAMANEPPSGETANAMLAEWVFDQDEIRDIPEDCIETHFHGVGLVACRDIPRDTEITWYYGGHYSRDYPTGHPCEISHTVHPPQSLGHKLPYDCVSPILSSPSASSDEDADPSYGSSVWGALTRAQALTCLRVDVPRRAYRA